MKPRRSRISRIYRHLTRRAPNRKAQWRQISQLRSHGSVGCPTHERPRAAYVPELKEPWSAPENASEPQEWFVAVPREPERQVSRRQDGTGPLVAVLSTSLFLMGCAYAAFAGYLLSVKPPAAYCAVAASIISLLAAGIGISLAASPAYRAYCARVLGTAVISLTALYGVLVAAVV
jgi:hypothetical protein